MARELALLKLSCALVTSGIAMSIICYEKTFENILLSDVAIFSDMSLRAEGATPAQMTSLSYLTWTITTSCKDDLIPSGWISTLLR